MNSIAINFVDCAIIVLYLIFIIWWGLRNGKSSDAGSYFLAGRTMPWWIVGLSLFAASISSTTLIGQSGDAYHTGVAVFNYNLTGVVVMVIVTAATGIVMMSFLTCHIYPSCNSYILYLSRFNI